MASVRAKFVVTFVNPGTGQVTLQPVTGSDCSQNKAFWKATPIGRLDMTLTKPKAIAQFIDGNEYYLDFTPATKAKTTPTK